MGSSAIYLSAVLAFFIGVWCAQSVHAAGNTTCRSSQLDWYTNAVGETPCTTYQRLRQICNGEYEVGNFRPQTPGDNCDDQVSTCCCNSIAWSLSMLCMNCQQDASAGGNGIDAGVGAYQMYLTSDSDGQKCGPGTNQSLPTNIQDAVCNLNIKLDDFLYGLFWGDGSWFYSYTRESAETDQATNNNNTFTHCPNQISSSASPTASKSSSSSSSSRASASGNATSNSGPTSGRTASASTSSTSSLSTSAISAPSAVNNDNLPTSSTSHSVSAGAIAGGSIGGAAALAVTGALLFWLWRKRRGTHVRPLRMSIASSTHDFTDTGTMMVEPNPFLFSGPRQEAQQGRKPTAAPFNVSYAAAHPSAPSASTSDSNNSVPVTGYDFSSSGTGSGAGPSDAPRGYIDWDSPASFSHLIPDLGQVPGSAESSEHSSAPSESGSSSIGALPDMLERQSRRGVVRRHEDGGPVVSLLRSASGRLPPAYDQVGDVQHGYV